MHILKKILVIVLVVFIVLQFFQPARNTNGQVLPTDISNVISMPENVQSILQAACYDCHSNKTNYPWYTYVQPVGWILAGHIKDGKKDLNFSEFGAYSNRKQQSKLKSIVSQVKDDEMPLYSYTIIHKDARLSKEEKKLIIDWAQNAKDSLEKISK